MSKSILKRNIYTLARYELVLDLIGNKIKGKRVLDVGCGDGVLSFFLAKRGAKVVGIDISKEAINFACKKCRKIENLNLEFLIASAYRVPFKNESFDYVVSSEVIEHLKYPEKMLFEVRRVWNKKGRIIITTPIKFREKPLDEMHYKEFFESEFKELLEKYFENVEVIKSHPLFWMEFLNKKVFGRNLLKYLLNLLNIILGFNPFKNTHSWRYYTLQVGIKKIDCH